MSTTRTDVAFVGGGLANGLLAYRLAQLHPELSLTIIEAAPQVGGQHTWSFFAGDLNAAEQAWLEPFVCARWSQYSVRFPAYERVLPLAYASIESARFADVLQAQITAGRISLRQAKVQALHPDQVILDDGQIIAATTVIDGRGAISSPHLQMAFQKFVGRRLRLQHPHGLQGPIVMDAAVQQRDGYRFLYVLPFSDTEVLVEDTRYTDGAEFDPEVYRRGITEYVADQGWAVAEIAAEEEGVLPIALGGDLPAFWREYDAVATIGLRAQLFHPTTGYSLPDAVRTADAIARLPQLDTACVARLLRGRSLHLWSRRRLYRFINRLLFEAAKPEQRYRVLERFYRLPLPLITRFYAGVSTVPDWVRLFVGKPPVSVAASLRTLLKRRKST